MYRAVCYPTWIRTKTSRTRICGTTVILSGNLVIAKIKNPEKYIIKDFLKLPDLDSNQDKQYQKLSYYHYTIGQSCHPVSGLGAQKYGQRVLHPNF